jgi:peptidyl-prolyl cis-trans isomerase SurA
MHRLLHSLKITSCRPLLAAGLALLLAAPTHAAQVLDRIVAVVNDDVVLQSELEQEIQTVSAQLRQRNTSIPSDDILARQVLERLIMQRLQLAIAERNGIRVDEATLNAAVQRIAEQNQLSLSQFRDTLEGEGYDYVVFRDSLRDEIILNRLHQRQAERQVSISPQEIDEYLASQGANDSTEYLLGHILIAVPESASGEQIQAARQQADEVRRALISGTDLAQLAAAYSSSSTALDGGSLGWRAQGELPTLFAHQVPQLDVGETGEIEQTPSGFHIIQLLDRRSSEQAMITQTHARHILIQTNAIVTDDDARLRLETLRRRIQGGTDFAELARANSNDKGSAASGGDLGWASPGMFVPAFERVMDTLAPGEISAPFQSDFGWHILQVLERRERDISDDLRRAKAAETIRQRKSEEALDSWLRRLREEAYVDLRLDVS